MSLVLVEHLDYQINLFELYFPIGVIYELSQVKAVVICGITLTVVCRCQYCALVSILRIILEEELDL